MNGRCDNNALNTAAKFSALYAKKVVCSIVLFIFLPANACGSLDFPNKNLRKEIVIKFFDSVEQLDAVTIEVRNKTRAVDWQTYRDINITKITNSENWDDLYQSLFNLHFGIINRHSYVLVSEEVTRQKTIRAKWPKYELGYTWPETTFFSLENSKEIQAINNIPVTDLFHTFFNFYCNDAHIQGCLSRFSEYMKVGYFFQGSIQTLLVEFSDGSRQIVEQKNVIQAEQRDDSTCENSYPNTSAKLFYDGHQVCLFRVDNSNVLRIRKFANWGTNYSDIYCVSPKQNGMCRDINYVKSFINEHEISDLVIDVQGNGGGSEVTPWIAALTRAGFYDNRIKYRNLDLLNDSLIRENAFYYSHKGERWFKKVTKTLDSKQEFLPVRADFCRGSINCEVSHIKSARYPIRYKNLKIITDRNCVSSCDDFIWRLKEFANAKVYGQPPATDGVYARLNGYLFLSKDKTVNLVVLGEDHDIPDDMGDLILSYRIPISKTVSKDGNTMEGDISVLDVPLSVTKENFKHIQTANLIRALSD